MKKLCLIFTIVFGVLATVTLATCLIAFLWHPYDLGEEMLMSYEDITGDLGHSVEGMWGLLSWISLWVCIGLFVFFGLGLAGAIFISPEDEEKEFRPKMERKAKKIEEAVEKETKEKKHLFRRKAKKLAEEAEAEAAEAVQEPVEEEVKVVKPKVENMVDDFLGQFKNKKR